MNNKEFFAQAGSALETMRLFIAGNDLATILIPDHLCYKCASHEEFLEIRSMLERESFYLYESWISDRLIAILKLKEPISTAFGDISYLELQDKKERSGPLSGFTHIEFYPATTTYETVLEKMKEKKIQIISDPTPHHPIHEVTLSDTFVFRLEHEPVIKKIKREEL
jgi:predicted metalloenzyme YecM